MDSSYPKVVLVFSGKRKSGKDYTSALLAERLGDICTILTLSAPLKHQYAEIHGLDFNQLLSASSYKERYRHDMVVWGEKKRNEDPAIFCRLATQNVSHQHKVWLISDARRKTDVAYFKEMYSDRAKLVRVQADESVRASRGYVFKKGVDDSETECGLDEGVSWDVIITNNGNQDDLDSQLKHLISSIQHGLINDVS
ncbi:phosphomevalonate kinase-like [Lytechinus variegatus]|uniref:phosphomevalonate kinase-like n=1 Tax=Lytechinus variegatus TaxID=7654 RepID=UPI001BB24E6D|nr:phosphomevalonate kinase-like [Lytechinus variegatus]XP_041464010.1 phosphomevalonate kinase-like [Lytechinus variegatus]